VRAALAHVSPDGWVVLLFGKLQGDFATEREADAAARNFGGAMPRCCPRFRWCIRQPILTAFARSQAIDCVWRGVAGL
jgi:hypothetical protein